MPSPIHATRLRTEYLVNPLCLATTTPRFFWWIEDDRAGAKQSAYRIRVATSREKLATPDLWDSGKIDADAQAHVAYAGKPLTSRTAAVWDVTLWDAAGETGEPSEVATFEVGLHDRSDWKGQWIGTPLAGTNLTSPPVPALRKTFVLDKPIRSARLYATALGLYEARLNGQRASDDYFRPGWTEYNKRVQYQAYDVTALLKQGENALGALLGDGWYTGRVGWGDRALYWGDANALLMQLEVTHDDNSVRTIATDASWQWAPSPILNSDFMAGEEYDARIPDPLSTEHAADKTIQWLPAVVRDVPDTFAIVAQPNESVRITQELPAAADPKRVGVAGHRTGFVYDLGQNFAGIVRLKIKGPRGYTVRLRFAEMLNSNGTLYTENLRSARCIDHYTLRGDPDGETYFPTFTFHGFRYVELSFANMHMDGRFGPTFEPPGRDAITGLVLHSDTRQTGDFSCSDERLNQLQRNITWGQRGNFLEVPTDCPQRDERLGWTGDAQVFAPTAAFNMDVAAFFTKWTLDCDDAQSADGGLPVVVPITRDLSTWGDGAAGWSDVRVIAPLSMYHAYADRAILERHYEPMKRWIEFQASTARDGIRGYEGFQQHRGFGDWCALDRTDNSTFGGTPLDFIGTAYYAHSAGLMRDIATLLGKTNDAARFAQMRTTARQAFDRTFVSHSGLLTANTQTAYLMALAFDLLPPPLRPGAVDQLLRLLEERDWHLSTGFLGTPLLLPVLTRFDKLDVAYRILMQTTYPGWLFTVSLGATTMWERWNSWTPDKGFGDVGMNSFNHYAYGAVGRWIYDTLGGLAIDPTQPGYKHAIIAPRPGGGVTHACTSIESLHGRFEVKWAIEADIFKLEVTIPPNTTATITLPDGKTTDVAAGTHKLQTPWAADERR